MTLGTILENGIYGGGIVFLILAIIQISPIKLNPWTAIARWIGRAINGDVLHEVSELRQDVKKNKDDDDEQWASLSRTHILRFNDELLHGVSHSKEHFDQILIDISKYENYCKTHPYYLNNVANASIEHIKSTYKKCMDENKFL